MLLGSLLTRVLLEVVKYLPPTFRVIQGELRLNFETCIDDPVVTEASFDEADKLM